jgi:hypothetical protein
MDCQRNPCIGTCSIPLTALGNDVAHSFSFWQLKHLYILGKQVNKTSQTPSPVIKIPSEFLCSELPIRYGHMLKMLHAHPLATTSPAMQKVANRYVSDTQLLTRLSVPSTETESSQFLQVLRTLRRRQCGSLLRLRHGLLTETQGDERAQDSVQGFLDQCNGLGVGVNLLIGKYHAILVWTLWW